MPDRLDLARDLVGDGLLRGESRSRALPLGLRLICEKAERGEDAVLSFLRGVVGGERVLLDGDRLDVLNALELVALELENPTSPPIALMRPPA